MSHRLPVADIQFISDFAAFCRTKGDEGYDYDDSHDCALAQFLRHSGRGDGGNIGNIFFVDHRGERKAIPSGVSRTADTYPYTFSALADRLEALVADAPEVERV